MKDNDEKIDALIEHAIITNSRLNEYNSQLKEHMKRSEASEQRLELLEDEVKPLLQHFQGIKWMFSALVALTAVLKFLEYFKH